MLLNNSHNDPEINRKINDLVGHPYSLLDRLKMKGIGSPKLRITKASMHIYNLLQLDQNTNTCNIELRPKGIILAFQKRLETYVLVIPYYKLSIYKGSSNEYSFHKDTYFIKILAPPLDASIHKFVSRIMSEKKKQQPTSLDDLL
ncbi:hypothetical protein [Aquimarina agarilytica]|uniref:hypothetical protein n=1 Tax=Aquimarina agarilytica TaxID=1087449 RepID=UPI0002892FE8|nr:hypothetical protein [Aquimarina agarilytica]